MWFCPRAAALLAVILLLARAAIATDASKHPIYDLNETQDEFNSTKSQEDGKQSHVPLHNVLGFNALGPRGSVQKVLSLSAGEGVVPLAKGIKTSWSFCQAQRCDNDAVARPKDSNDSYQSRRKHRASLATVFVSAAATAIILFQPNEDKRWQEYQQAPSKDARKEPHEAAEVVFRGVLGFAIGKVKQDVSYDAEDGEPHQGMSDASRALAVAHGGVPAAKSFSLPSVCGSVMPWVR